MKSKGSILVIDDEESILAILSEFLTKRNYDVKTAQNGRDALDIIQKSVKETQIGEAIKPPKAEVSEPSTGDTFIEEKVIEKKKNYQFIHENFFGVLSSISGDRLIIEPLIDIQANLGSYILIKRRNTTGEKVDVALATIVDVSEGKIISSSHSLAAPYLGSVWES